jgi:hypothetical protein
MNCPSAWAALTFGLALNFTMPDLSIETDSKAAVTSTGMSSSFLILRLPSGSFSKRSRMLKNAIPASSWRMRFSEISNSDLRRA